MNVLKKWLGWAWMLLAPVTFVILMNVALQQINAHPVTDTIIQWGIFVIIYIPIAIGLFIFGWFAWKDEYRNNT